MTEKERQFRRCSLLDMSAEMMAEVKRLDALSDDDSISDEQFDALMEQAAELTRKAGKLEKEAERLDGPELRKVSEWLEGFLGGFQTGTRTITLKQAAVFQRLPISAKDGYKLFWVGGRRYFAEMPNYRAGFSRLVVAEY